MCRKGGRGENGHGVTQECFNQDVLTFDIFDARQRYGDRMGPTSDDPSDYIGTSPSVRCDGPGAELKLEAPQIWSPPGSCCYGGGDCGDSNTSKTQNVRFVFPSGAAGPEYKLRLQLPNGLSCTQENPCTIQWTFMTGNSADSYPEVFRNCADFKIDTDGSSPTPSPTAAPTPLETRPEPEPEPEPEPTLAPTPTPTQTDGTVECDNGTGSCKDQCSKACGYDVQINQCWGSPRFIQCQCKDSSVHFFAGCACENSQCPSIDPTSFPTLNPTPAPTLAPTPSTLNPTPAPTITPSPSTLNPTPAPTFAPTSTPAPTPVSSSCIDVRGESCQHCLASNNVCYAEQKAWCDIFQYTWCGAPSLVQEEDVPASRKRVRSQGFLGLIQTSLSFDSFKLRERADDFDEF